MIIPSFRLPIEKKFLFFFFKFHIEKKERKKRTDRLADRPMRCNVMGGVSLFLWLFCLAGEIKRRRRRKTRVIRSEKADKEEEMWWLAGGYEATPPVDPGH